MVEGRSRLILLSLAVADSVWLFALFSILGLITGLGGSPLPWVSLLAFIFIAIGIGYLLGAVEGDEVSIAMKQSIFGLVLIYLFLGSGTFIGDTAFDAGWLFRLIGGDLERTAGVSAVFGLIILVWLWWRGLKIGTDQYPEDRLVRVFKMGIGVLAVATLVEQATSESFGAGTLLVPFFGASLVGLAVGRLPEGGVGRNTGEWVRIIGLSVFGIMGIGLLIGLLGGLYGNGGVRLLYSGWGLLVDGVLWILRYPVTWLTAIIQWLLDLFANDPAERVNSEIAGQGGPDPTAVGSEATGAAGSSIVETVVNILQYPVIILIIIVVFFLLTMAFRKFGSRRKPGDDEDRESIRSELDTAGDMSRLLGGLIPGWMRRKPGRIWRYPDDPGFAEVFKLYFESIRLGVRRGMEFKPQMTPDERLPLLQAALPGAPVQEVTGRFNAACYGGVPTDLETVDELRLRLKTAEDEMRRKR